MAIESRGDLASRHGSIVRIAGAHSGSYRSDNPICTRTLLWPPAGRINARELHEQMNSCSCLTLILACIIYWQAKQITQTVPSGAVAEEGIDATLLQHVSPIEWATSSSTASTSSIRARVR